ncbi:hypothetical protein F0562_003281 [Nyssa sinensis]|uniref:Uncharacterized protein n=1 Tax=Nyssa sinensis TaxID=561372 RepID=A0A5J5BYZ2_9ASTE|nr:hypothetical protein F0562_003281 [Nyssa sinensis]
MLSIASPIDEPLVREFYVKLEIVKDQHQSGFPYVVGATPRDTNLARALRHDRLDVFHIIGACLNQGLLSDDYRFLNLVVSYDLSPISYTNTLTQSHSTFLYVIATKDRIDDTYIIFTTIDGATSGHHTDVLLFDNAITRICVSQGVSIYTSDMVRELSGPFTKRTLTQSKHYVGQHVTDIVEDIEVDDATEGGGGVVPNEDYLAIHECQDQFAASLFAMATNMNSCLLDDDNDDDDDDNNDGHFTPDTTTA